MQIAYFSSPIGWLQIVEENELIAEVKFIDADSFSETSKVSALLEDCIKQLTDFFNGNRTKFDLPLAPKGTDFQKTV